ncbi:hypothetical protein ACMZ7W_00165 [Gardnerella vaginalis]|uniref:hypothetical protein n=1 Tax=Gardnerella vaginalis TaxID=2702 RepID=UPI0039EFF451
MRNFSNTMLLANDDDNETFWEVVNSNFPNENIPTQFQHGERKTLPVFEGLIPVGSSRSMASYHVSSCFNSKHGEKMYLYLAMQICKVACIIGDISHGRPISPEMKNALTKDCLYKLENMWYLINECYKDKHNKSKISDLRSSPTIPKMINGILVSPSCLEAVVLLYIGPNEYWASLKLQFKMGRWICTLADIG